MGEPLGVTIRRVALPAVIANLLMMSFHNIDTFWIGRYLGSASLAAVTSSVFWVWLVISIGEVVSIGVDAMAARRHGERRPSEAARTVGDGLMLAVLLGGAVALSVPFLLSSMFSMMHTSPDVTDIGKQYLGTYLLGMPLIFGFFAVDAAFRASGDTRTPLMILTVTTVIALVLDPVLILGLAGAPALGVKGGAFATLVPRGLACIVGITLLARRRMIRFAKPRLVVLRDIVRIGGPAATTGVAFSFIYVVLNRTTTQFGTPALAALGLGFRVESFVYLFSAGLGAAVAAIVGQSIGAGNYQRAHRAGWAGVAVASIPGAVMALALFVIPDWFASVFTTDPAVIAETTHYLRITAIAQIFLGAEIVFEVALGGAGYTLPPMVVSTAITALRIPIGAWAAAQWGTTGLWWTLSLTAIARGIVMALIWQSGRWRRVRV